MPRKIFVYDKTTGEMVPITAVRVAQSMRNAATWPRVSDANAVHPSQIRETQEYLAKKGVYTEFEEHTGRPIFRDKAHKYKHMDALELCDPDASYGDRAPLKLSEERWKQLRRY